MSLFVDSEGALQASPTHEDSVSARNYDDADVVADVPGFLDGDEGLDNSGLGLLEEGDTVSVTITTKHGETESVEFQVPDTLAENAGGSV